MTVAVWAHKNHQGNWTPYPPEVSNEIEKVYLAESKQNSKTKQVPRARSRTRSKVKLDLGFIGPEWVGYEVDIASQQQIGSRSGKCVPVKRFALETSSALSKGFIWEFEGEDGWTFFDLQMMELIETAKGKSKTKRTLLDLTLSLGLPYIIDVNKLIQTRVDTGKQRRLRRRKLTLPYVKDAADSSDQPEKESLPDVNHIKINTRKRKIPLTAKEVIKKHINIVERSNLGEAECCICCESLTSASAYGDEGAESAFEVVELNKCGHQFHHLCLLQMCSAGSQSDFIQCPSCKFIYGEKTGVCPDGIMTWSIRHGTSLPSWDGHDTISVMYDIRPGVQGPEHPHPGEQYYTQGFPRIGYLPDTDKGRKILKLLIEAWRRRLIFTVGMSTTTGADNVVTWNEIHHKTELSGNYSGHGYPDPGYLDSVLQELACHGVTEDCLA